MTSKNTATALTLIKGTSAINKAIDSIACRGKKLDRDIQIAALSCMAHHQEYGDITLMNRLIDNMPKGSRVNALREFVQAFSGMDYDEAEKMFKHAKGKPCDLTGASECMWTDFKPEAPYKPFDAGAEIMRLVKKLSNADPAKGDKFTDEQAQGIRELASKLGVQV